MNYIVNLQQKKFERNKVRILINVESLGVLLPEDILKLEYYGDYEHALKVIEMRLKKSIPNVLRERLEYEKIRIERLKDEYIYSYDDAVALGQKEIKGFSRTELEELKDLGYADWAYVDGNVKFQRRFLANIIKTYPNIKDRFLGCDEAKAETEKISKALEDTIDEIIEKGKKSYYIRIKSKVKLMKETSETGKTVKVYIPIPALCQQVKNINIIKTEPQVKFVSPVDYPQRTVYFEKEVCGEDEFSVEYSYENHVVYNSLDAEKVPENQPDFDTEELAPHIVFSPYLKKLATEITLDEKNPLKKARAIYDYITTKVYYSFVREYSTIENIPHYAALNLKGDCGIQALLFITLCRLSGIPARWQSGLYVNPYYVGSHDWVQFFIEPYGWLFADCSFGGGAYRAGNTKKWNFYFGNLDPFRMPANSKFQYALAPGKKFLRADPYDNQRGEVEYQDKAVYFDGFEAESSIVEMYEI